MKTRKVYQKPMMESEAFVPSAYCAVCYQVACDVWKGEPYGENYGYDPYHTPKTDKYNWEDYIHQNDHCGNPNNQVITVNDAGRVTSMTEVGTDGLGNLTCHITSSLDFAPGMYVEWTTSAGSRTWTHHGVVEAIYGNRPNMS